jgi:putative MFS transporter
MIEDRVSTSNIANRLERLPVSWLHYKLLIIHGFGWLFDAMDVGIVTFVMVALAKDWKLLPNQLGLIGSAGLAGMFLGALVSGIIADYWGRKKVFQVTLFIFAVTTLLCACAWNVTSLIIFRFLVGVGLGGELPVVSSLLSEFIPGKHRGRFIVLLESFWAYGWLIAALVAFLIIPAHGWRIAFVIGAIPAFYIWVVRRKLPE